MASFTFEALFGGGIDPKLKRMVAVSALAHLTLFALILVLARSTQLPVDYRSSIQVALVDLPEVDDLEKVKLGAPKPKQLPSPQAKKPEPKPAKKAKPPAEPKKKVVAIEEVKKTEKKAADAKAKKEPAAAAARMDSAVERLRKQNLAVARVKQRALDTAMPEGTPGGNVRGIGALRGLAYDAMVQSVLRENWEVPVTFFGQNLHTEVFVRINQTGRIVEWRIVRGSGNPAYDDTVFRAFRKIEVGPGFPQPDPEIYNAILKDGYVIDMHPEDFFS